MMSTEEQLRAEVAKWKTESLSLAQCLHTVLSETGEGEVARIALAGLSATDSGRAYLHANPFRY